MLSALRCRAVNEECYTYNECNVYASLGASKPVFGIEYCDTTPRSPGCFCANANAAGYDFLLKRLDLGAAGISCTKYCSSNTCTAAATCGACSRP